MTYWLTAISANVSHRIYTLQNWNTSRDKSSMHLVTRDNYLRLLRSCHTLITTHRFRRANHSTRLQRFSPTFSAKTSRPFRTHNANHVDGPVGKALSVCQLTVFEPATQAEISNLLRSSPVKSCEFYPFPTWLLRDCAHEVVPLLTAVINLSLRSYVVPARLKKAHVRALLRKPGLD